jgi:hypothetical protein
MSDEHGHECTECGDDFACWNDAAMEDHYKCHRCRLEKAQSKIKLLKESLRNERAAKWWWVPRFAAVAMALAPIGMAVILKEAIRRTL